MSLLGSTGSNSEQQSGLKLSNGQTARQDEFHQANQDSQNDGKRKFPTPNPCDGQQKTSATSEQRAKIQAVKDRAFAQIRAMSEANNRKTRAAMGAMYSRLAQYRFAYELGVLSISSGTASALSTDTCIEYDPGLYLPKQSSGPRATQDHQNSVYISQTQAANSRDTANDLQTCPATPTHLCGHTQAASDVHRADKTSLLTPPDTPKRNQDLPNPFSSPPAKHLPSLLTPPPTNRMLDRIPFSLLPLDHAKPLPITPNRLTNLTTSLLALPPSLPSIPRLHRAPCAQCTALHMPCNAHWPSCQRCTLRLHLAADKASRCGREDAFYALPGPDTGGGAECCIPQQTVRLANIYAGRDGMPSADVALAATLSQLGFVQRGENGSALVVVPVRLPLDECVVHAHHGLVEAQHGEQMGEEGAGEGAAEVAKETAEAKHWEGQVRAYMELFVADVRRRERENWVAPRRPEYGGWDKLLK